MGCPHRRVGRSMPTTAVDDWATGISELLGQLIEKGADDDELTRFVEARRAGDSELADRILNEPSVPRVLPVASDLGSALDDALLQVRVVALKPFAKTTDSLWLYRYIEIMCRLSEGVVKALRDEPFWSSKQSVQAVGEVIRRSALEQLKDFTNRRPSN